jgi:chromate reductase, NAD(P)H dehydrogenase (quinone)
MDKITILSCTNRPNSNTRRVCSHYETLIKSEGIDVQVFDFLDLPNDFLFSELYGKRSSEFQEKIKHYVSECQRFIFIVPEYNGSYPGVLKLVLDSISPKEWANKKALITGVSDGRAGNLRGMEHLTGVLNYLKVNVYHNKLPISMISKVMDTEGKINSQETMEVIHHQLKGFLGF